jgi:hypothetical protein
VSASDEPRTAQNSVRDQLVAAAHREPDPSRTAQTHVRDALVAAGVREYGAAAPQRRRRRRRRATGLVVIGLLGAATVANATGLLSVGEEIPPLADREAGSRYAPVSGDRDIVMTADDPDRKLNWGVAVYTSRNGSDCALGGQVQGNRIGLERNGVFRPFSDDFPGSCGNLKRLPQMVEFLHIEGEHPRTIVYGRTSTPDKRFGFRLKSTGETKTVSPGRGGAFLFVYDGRVMPDAIDTFKP